MKSAEERWAESGLPAAALPVIRAAVADALEAAAKVCMERNDRNSAYLAKAIRALISQAGGAMTFEEWRRMTLLPGDNVKAAWKAWEASRTYALVELEREKKAAWQSAAEAQREKCVLAVYNRDCKCADVIAETPLVPCPAPEEK
jgi:hypothetical protein